MSPAKVVVGNSKKIVHVQTVMFAEDVEALKHKTGENNIKDAVAAACEYYLNLPDVAVRK